MVGSLARRILDQGRLGPARRQQHVGLVHAGGDELLSQRVGQLGAGIGDHFAGVGIRDRKGQDPGVAVPGGGGLLVFPQVQRGVPGKHDHRLDAHVAHRVDALGGELIAHLSQRRASGILGVGHIGRQQRADDFAALLPALELPGDVEHLGREEEPQNVGVGSVAERPQQRGGRELLLLVDVDVDHIVNVDRELHPGAPERNNPGREQPLAVGMGFFFEHHAGRAVQLAHHHPLRAIDDEGAQRGHDGQLAQVDLALDLVLQAPLAVHVLEHVEEEGGFERRGIGHVALDALLDRVLGLAQGIALEVELVLPVHIGNREEVAEHAFQ